MGRSRDVTRPGPAPAQVRGWGEGIRGLWVGVGGEDTPSGSSRGGGFKFRTGECFWMKAGVWWKGGGVAQGRCPSPTPPLTFPPPPLSLNTSVSVPTNPPLSLPELTHPCSCSSRPPPARQLDFPHDILS